MMLKIVSLLTLIGTLALAKDWEGAPYTWLFQYSLPIPIVKEPYMSYNNIDYYEINIKPVEYEIYPGKKTRLVGYDGMVPGPTFKMKQGREAVVRFVNHADRANSVHLHGSYSRAPFDGWAEDITKPGEYKDYYYPNAQNARTLWYHDHAIDHTAENAYYGQAGFYILHDDQELALPLPQGDFDIPLGLAAKRYNSDGSLWDPEANQETTSVFGDVIHVNGQPWPYLNVTARKYRFRLLDASVSRSFQLYLEADKKPGNRIPFTVIASDAGLLERPVDTTQLDISMAERWEIVVDFTNYEGQNLTMRSNAQVGADTPYLHTDKIMRFVVAPGAVADGHDPLPAKLRTVPYPPQKTTVDKQFEFQRANGHWEISGHTWADGALDPTKRVLANPPRGSIQLWELKNGGGGWTHPIHIHLIDFQIVSRTGGRPVQPYEQVALKDVVWLNVGETVQVLARYAPWDGLYMFHCHNLIHEDHEMMAAFNVSYLEDLNYPETTRFIDPMEPRYRAVPFVEEDYRLRTGPFTNASITDKCTFFESLKGYSGAAGAEEALVAYWNTHTTSTTALATTALATTALATTALATTALTTTTPTTFRTSTTSTKSTSKRAS